MRNIDTGDEQLHELQVNWGEHSYSAFVYWRPLDDGGDYTADVVGVYLDEYAPDSQSLIEEVLWAFWYDWRQGRVKLYI